MNLVIATETLNQYVEVVVPDTEEEWKEWRRLREEATPRFMGHELPKLPTDKLERLLREITHEP